jgi:inosine/xanthosine triphosphatase
MIIAVGTLNPVKIRAVKEVFRKVFGEVQVRGVEVSSGVPPQPYGFEQTIRGAVNRAKRSFSKDCRFSVGIEAGLIPVPNSLSGYFDIQITAIYDGKRISLGAGPGFEYPLSVVKETLKGREVGEVMEKFTGIPSIGEKMGAIGYLSKGMMDRTKLTEISILMALIPFLNFEEYF